ncbi:YdcF family protein [Nocardia jejuensis]|uniref:YdcF family protein n=1 Tax=Nocardia jejuensis TaxID=328049 RepID=UPI000ACD0D61|nr:YdcF family protein [Nocardia jejuensis]
MTARPPSRRPRRYLRYLLALLCVVAALVGLGYPVYVRPQIDALRHADAILVLGGEGVDRYAYGLDLARQGYADTVLFSNPYGEFTDIDEIREPCHTPQQGFTLECFAPDPPTTLGEARELRRIATENDWHTVIVVTMRPHLSRARFILSRCFTGNLVMRDSPVDITPWYWAWSYLYQTAGYARALTDRC